MLCTVSLLHQQWGPMNTCNEPIHMCDEIFSLAWINRITPFKMQLSISKFMKESWSYEMVHMASYLGLPPFILLIQGSSNWFKSFVWCHWKWICKDWEAHEQTYTLLSFIKLLIRFLLKYKSLWEKMNNAKSQTVHHQLFNNMQYHPGTETNPHIW